MPKRQAPYYQHASQSTEGSTGQAGPSGSQDSIVANNRVFGRLISYASVTSASGQKAYYWIQSQPAANGAWADDSYGLACTAVASGQQTGYAWEVNGTSTLTANSIVELEYMGGVLDARGESWRIVLSSQGASSFTLAGRTGSQTIASGDTMTLANGVVSATDTWTPDVASASLAGIVDTGTQTFAGAKTFEQPVRVGASGTPAYYMQDRVRWELGEAANYEAIIQQITIGGSQVFDFTIVDNVAAYSSDPRFRLNGQLMATGTDGLGNVFVGGLLKTLGGGTAFTDELAQDAVGTICADSATIDFDYNDGTPSITAAAIYQMSITADASGLKLSGDSASPGNSYYYGTNGAGTKGYYALGTMAFEPIGVASFGPAAVASITIVNGVVTAIS